MLTSKYSLNHVKLTGPLDILTDCIKACTCKKLHARCNGGHISTEEFEITVTTRLSREHFIKRYAEELRRQGLNPHSNSQSVLATLSNEYRRRSRAA